MSTSTALKRLDFRPPRRWPWRILQALGHCLMIASVCLLAIDALWLLNPPSLAEPLAPAGSLSAFSLTPLLLGYWLQRMAVKKLRDCPALVLAKHLRR
ncbi:hypothetical protein [Atopomonas sediminilitoris]|uniref:hypothetical protein n=1 Tax=Atopomonas sediminilitoris TaxID=2919919 RepID=UPI001F4E52B8|nr:hypothetical protein [Atopomonas sediminilitoris]MCJ8168949.1 hypothetical protein [Atopomonas sediminilitoris]